MNHARCVCLSGCPRSSVQAPVHTSHGEDDAANFSDEGFEAQPVWYLRCGCGYDSICDD